MSTEEKKSDFLDKEILKEEMWPSMKKYFSDDQKFRVISLFSRDSLERFKVIVEAEYGKFGPYECKEAVDEAIKNWIDKKTK